MYVHIFIQCGRMKLASICKQVPPAKPYKYEYYRIAVETIDHRIPKTIQPKYLK